jgi:hypothetical protein
MSNRQKLRCYAKEISIILTATIGAIIIIVVAMHIIFGMRVSW